MNSKNEILQNLNTIGERIRNACEKAGRSPEEVKLLLAVKTVTPEKIITAVEAGFPIIGENKVQEIKAKYEALEETPHETHFIGHLQTNKIKEILRYGVDCIQTVDRLKLAEKLQRRLEFEDKTMDVLIQVNTSGEESKFGVSPAHAIPFLKEVVAFDRIFIRGFMTIGLFSAEWEKVRLCFRLLREIRDEAAGLNLPRTDLKELSMGMSGDLEIAIEEGATMIRVGTAVFGERMYPDSYYWPDKG